MSPGRFEDSVFRQVLGESTHAVEDAVIADERVGETSLERVARRLAELLGTNRGETLKLLGVSRTKMSRNPEMNVEILNRIGSALKLYARIAAMVGPEGAPRWLCETNRHLGGKRPIDLMASHLGHTRVEELVTALEDGTFLWSTPTGWQSPTRSPPPSDPAVPPAAGTARAPPWSTPPNTPLAALEMLTAWDLYADFGRYPLCRCEIDEDAIHHAVPVVRDTRQGIHDIEATRQHGDDWVQSRQSVPLRVPSFVSAASCDDLLDADHPDVDTSTRRTHLGPYPYDARLLELLERAKTNP